MEFDNDKLSNTEPDQFAILESKISALIDQLKRVKRENGELIQGNAEAQPKVVSQREEINTLRQAAKDWKQKQQQVHDRIKSLIERIEGVS